MFAVTCPEHGFTRLLHPSPGVAGGPAGAILLVGTTAIIDACNFHNSIASTSGGAIAAADRLRNDSNAYNVPNLVVRTSTFTNNIARRQNGGALLATGMNATTFTSTFKRNVAGGNGGAVVSWLLLRCVRRAGRGDRLVAGVLACARAGWRASALARAATDHASIQ